MRTNTDRTACSNGFGARIHSSFNDARDGQCMNIYKQEAGNRGIICYTPEQTNIKVIFILVIYETDLAFITNYYMHVAIMYIINRCQITFILNFI
jgi:hypothetical protein